MFIPYTLGTVVGSVSGAKISMWIELRLMASSDEHLKRTRTYMSVTQHTNMEGRPLSIALPLHGPYRNDQEARAQLAKMNLQGKFSGILLQGVALPEPMSTTA